MFIQAVKEIRISLSFLLGILYTLDVLAAYILTYGKVYYLLSSFWKVAAVQLCIM